MNCCNFSGNNRADCSGQYQYGSSECMGDNESPHPSPMSFGGAPSMQRTNVDSGDITDCGDNPYTANYLVHSPGNTGNMPGSDFMQILQMLMALLSRLFGSGNGLGSDTSSGSDLGFNPLSVSKADGGGGGGSYASNQPPASRFATGADQNTHGGQGASGTTGSTQSQASGAGQDIPVGGGGPNTIKVTNKSDKVQCYAIFTNPGPGATSSFEVPNGFVTLRPGESANFKVPAQYSGYVQQMNNYTEADYINKVKPDPLNFKATRAEFTFDDNGNLSYNKSAILGYNADLGMSSGGQKIDPKGSIISDVEKRHPNLIQHVGGQKIIDGPDSFNPGRNMEAAQALDQYLNNSGNPYDYGRHSNSYVLPDDHAAVRVERSNQLSLEFGNA